MKVCPSCKTQYTDDSLAFCLQDGSPLVAVESAPIGTTEAETVVRHRQPVVGNGSRSEVTRVADTAGGRGSKAMMIIAVLLIALIGAVIVLALGLTWYFWRPSPAASNNSPANTHNVNSPININRGSPTPTASPSPSATVASSTPTPRTNTGDEVAVSEVRKTIEKWREATEAMDSGSLMQNYASTVTYYRLGSASSDFVRRDKERAFKIFTSMSMEISNLNVSVAASGDQASAEFDKEWVFRGGGDLMGKARSQLKFSKVDGRWLITAERDLRVYYLNTK